MPRMTAGDRTVLKVGDKFEALPGLPAYTVAEATAEKLVLQLDTAAHQASKYKGITFAPEVTLNAQAGGRAITHTVGRRDTSSFCVSVDAVSRDHGTIHYNAEVGGYIYEHLALNESKTSGRVYKPGEKMAVVNAEGSALEVEAEEAGTVMIEARPELQKILAEARAAAGQANNNQGQPPGDVLPPKDEDKEQKTNMEIPLKRGVRLQFHPVLPWMQVTEVSDSPKKLVLTQEKGPKESFDPRCPQKIEVGELPATIARSADKGTYAMMHATISNPNGIIGWEEGKGFVYSNFGASMPLVGPALGFVAEQQKICDEMKVESGAEAIEGISQAKRLLARIAQYQKNLDRVQHFEGSIVDYRRDDDERGPIAGGKTEESQIGYALWFDTLGFLYRDSLTDKEKGDITHVVGAIKGIARDRAELRDIEDEHKRQLPEYDRATRDRTPYAADLQKYTDRKVDELGKTGETYLVAGYRGHHEVARIQKDGEGYKVAFYNAGSEAKDAPKGPDNPKGNKVKGMYEHRLAPGVDPAEFIRTMAEKKIRPMFDPSYIKLTELIEGKIGGGEVQAKPSVGGFFGMLKAAIGMGGQEEKPSASRSGGMLGEELRYRAVEPQKEGNCTTRSTRHAVEDVVGLPLMARLGRYVADPDYSKAEDLKVGLQMQVNRLVTLASQLGEQVDAGDVSAAVSVADLRVRAGMLANIGDQPINLDDSKDGLSGSGSRRMAKPAADWAGDASEQKARRNGPHTVS